MAGKGDRLRPFDRKKWDAGWAILERSEPMDSEIVFQGMPKITRLSRPCIITEKIDGTNAQVLVTEGGQVFAGSKKRWIMPEKDNFGFAAWVQEHADELRQLGLGRHFGEWWGQGIQRGYGLQEKRFSLFNVSRWQSPRLMIDGSCSLGDLGIKRRLAPACCHVVPVLWTLAKLSLEDVGFALAGLVRNGSCAAPGFMDPEGIVIYHTQGNVLFKKTLKNDDKGKEHGA